MTGYVAWGTLFLAITVATPFGARVSGNTRDERADLDAIARIRAEATGRSQLMETASDLTDLYGPRLTGSPILRGAADYVLGRLTRWGFQDSRLEAWGPFGPGWSNDRFVALAVSPRTFPLIAYSKAWSPGTSGPLRAEAVLAPVTSDKDFQTYHGKLRGKFVLIAPPDGARGPNAPPANAELARKRMEFFLDEGAAALLEPDGELGMVVARDGRLTRPAEAGLYPWPEDVASQIALTAEHYNWIARTLQKGVPVTLELDVVNTYHTADPDSFNVIAEIAGRDRGGQVVMVGAHLDSWHGGAGAIDSAAGCAVVLEAVRILKATGLPLKRTVRVALWTGTEQGMLGSRAYVRQHFGDASSGTPKPEHAKLSAYFNFDEGTGPIRGIALYGNNASAPAFRSWMAPFIIPRRAGPMTVSVETATESDASSFEAVGLPAFQFIQESNEDERRARASNMDLYERLRPADLIQNAVVVASTLYHAANREELMPRRSSRR